MICPLFLQEMIAKGLIEAKDLKDPESIARKLPVACIQGSCGHWNPAACACGHSVPQYVALEALGNVVSDWGFRGVRLDR